MIAILSDAHLEDAADPAQRDLVDWLDGLDAEALVLGGDLFHFWWGRWPRPQARYQPATDALARAAARGIAITWIPGNHDFAVGSHIVARTGLTVTPRWERRVGDLRVVVVHGDEADRSLGYRLTRRLLRGRAFGALVDALGERRGEALLERLAGGSRAHMRPAAPLVAAQRRWAEAELEAGADVVCLGHTHALGIVETPAGRVVHLGDWGEQRTWLQLDDAGIQLQRFGPDAG